MDWVVEWSTRLAWLWELLTVLAGVTFGLFALMYRRWWQDTREQLEHSRQVVRILSKRLGAYRIAAAVHLAEQLDDQGDAPDSPGGPRPGGVEGA